jgi:GxxExxY protein
MSEADELNVLTEKIIGFAMKVHTAFGPGLLENVYSRCLGFELTDAGHKVEHEKTFPVVYRGRKLDFGYRLDLLVDDKVIVECKAVEKMLLVHESQVRSYLKLTGCKVGLLINFNVTRLKSGITRVVYNFPD